MNEPEEGHILSKGVRDVLRRLQRRPEDQAHTVRVYPFHHQYPGTEQLYHVTCEQHPEFGYCGEAREASAVAKAHSAESLGATVVLTDQEAPALTNGQVDELTSGMCGRPGCPWRVRNGPGGWGHLDTHGAKLDHEAVPPPPEIQRLRTAIRKVQDALYRHDESDSGALGLFYTQVSDALEEAGL